MAYYTHTEQPIGRFILRENSNHFEYSLNDEVDDYSRSMADRTNHLLTRGGRTMTYTESRKSYSIRTKSGEPIITFQDEHQAMRYWQDIEELVMKHGHIMCIDETTIVSKEIEL